MRISALLGLLAIFSAIVSSAYMRPLARFFGQPFIRVHHAVAITGLVLITLHPLAVALEMRSALVFLPRFDSWRIFLELGGRTAWYLLAIASGAAVLRQTLGRQWRLLHLLNYAAFFLGVIHANLIGTSFQQALIRGLSMVLALSVGWTLIQKRIPRRRK
jgi:DMSO/TMAO reductase YedYZ heme-binding membrane subunit